MEKPKKNEGLSPHSETFLEHIHTANLDLNSYDYFVGLDEVGVACLAGPVVAGAFLYSVKADWVQNWKNLETPRITDSKKLSADKRKVARNFLLHLKPALAVTAEASVAEIDRINIFWASKLAMKRCLEALLNEMPELKEKKLLVFVDGNHPLKDLDVYSKNWFCEAVVKGDGKIFPVAAASIFAKEHRDTFMEKLSEDFPGYGWETNVGYPTPAHKKALLELGINLWHRRSFDLGTQVEMLFG